VLSKGRAWPRTWRVRQGPKGHVPADLPIAWVELVRALLPAGTTVGCLGEGEGDGIKRQETMTEAGGWDACRPAPGHTATWADETVHGDALGAWRKPGRLSERKEVAVTREASGPVRRRCGWAKGQAEPVDVVRKMSSAEEAIASDQKRFRMETFFADQQSRGCNIHKSHVTDPQRLSR
jgi:hypothetical protein